MTRTRTWVVAGLAGVAAATLPAAGIAAASPPASPGSYGTAAPNAQCGTAAESGSFNAHNAAFGPNSSAFGLSGGAGGGQAGLSNSAVCGNR